MKPRALRNLYLSLALLSTLMALMQLLGLFASGFTPIAAQFAASIVLLALAFQAHKRVVPEVTTIGGKAAWKKWLLWGMGSIVSILLLAALGVGLFAWYVNGVYDKSEVFTNDKMNQLLPNIATVTASDLTPYLHQRLLTEKDQVSLTTFITQLQSYGSYINHQAATERSCTRDHDGSMGCDFKVAALFSGGAATILVSTEAADGGDYQIRWLKVRN